MKCNNQIYDIVVSFSIRHQSTRYARVIFTPVKSVHVNNGETALAI